MFDKNSKSISFYFVQNIIMSIEVQNISKSYGAQKSIRQYILFSKKRRNRWFLGPNGAGKSTLMKILTTYLSADEGVR
jgi:ABC-2 type transport system ATP-binding protein